jgi:hypothetical protein
LDYGTCAPDDYFIRPVVADVREAAVFRFDAVLGQLGDHLDGAVSGERARLPEAAISSPTMSAERDAITSYLDDVESRLRIRTTEGPEAQLAGPMRTLIRALAVARGRPDVDLLDQAHEPGIGRPDFSAKDGSILIGHLETKPLGKGSDPKRFKEPHDRDQWNRFRRLPNLIYTDGREFALYRSGAMSTPANGGSGRVVLPLDPDRHNPRVLSNSDVRDLVDLVVQFIGWEPIAPRTLADLADRLAPLCATLRDAVVTALSDEASSVSLVSHEVREALFPDADDQSLADAYAQTCAYSLLLARAEGAPSLDAATVETTLRGAHPVLARVVRVLLDPEAEAEISWAVEVVRRQIGAADLVKLGGGDPDTWIYFYEQFLGAYDPTLRDSRGVYYTPREVIAAQVALCEDILATRFGKPEQFADEDVVVLDPAVGTGSYPLRVVKSAAKSAGALGPGFVPAAITSLAQRLHGFEILIGPYAVAHLRLSEAIRTQGGQLPPDGARLYLTDTLASPHTDPPPLAAVPPLAREQRRAKEFKATMPVVVCLGNPPYNREQHEPGHVGRRRGGWVRYGEEGHAEGDRPLLDDWLDPLSEAGLGVHAKNAYNDYIYFWRWGVWKVFERHPDEVATRGGILTFISASSFLRGPAFAFMRAHLRELCDDIYVIDLGGDGRGTRRSENVFDIMTPVAITVCVRDPGKGDRAGRVHYVDWTAGTRAEKLERLDKLRALSDVGWVDVVKAASTDTFTTSIEGDWGTWPLLSDLFPWKHTGVEVKRTWPIAPNLECLRQRWADLLAATPPDRDPLFKATRDRGIESTPGPLRPGALNRTPLVSLPASEQLDAEDISVYDFRSYDRQYLIADERLGDFLRPVLWRAHGNEQLYLVSQLAYPLGKGPGLSVAAASPPDRHFYSGRGGADVLPLYRDIDGSRANLPAGLLDQLSGVYGRVVDEFQFAAYVVGIMGTPDYGARFAVELSEPGPRVPLTADGGLFAELAEIGARIIFLASRGERGHRTDWTLPRGSARVEEPIPSTVDTCPNEIEYNVDALTLQIGEGKVRPISPDVWAFETSGYSVVQEWILRRLREPRGKTSSPLDRVRPIAWDSALQRELLTVLAIVEELVEELTPRASELIDAVLAGPLLLASDLPVPTAEERRAPRTS